MATAGSTENVIRAIARELRVMTLGGAAVIAHGLSRNTHDADIWVEPLASPLDWASRVAPHLYGTGVLRPLAIGSWTPISHDEFAEVIGRDGVVRVMGMERPLDIFRDPNELGTSDFPAIWGRGIPLDDGTRLPDAVDLLVSKQDTGRDKDIQDIVFLEAKAEREYLEKLPGAGEGEAIAMLARFLTPRVAEAGLTHPAAAVRELAGQFLRELAEEGNPFAADILKRL